MTAVHDVVGTEGGVSWVSRGWLQTCQLGSPSTGSPSQQVLVSHLPSMLTKESYCIYIRSLSVQLDAMEPNFLNVA